VPRRPYQKRVPKPSWALIRIDSTPIREKARLEYQKVVRDLEQARRALEEFQKKDQPGFNQWLNRQFGALITELRETNRRLHAQRELLTEIESEAFVANCSHTRAYERVQWRRQHPQPEEEPVGSEGSEQSQRRSRRRAGPQTWEDLAEELFAGLDEAFADAFGPPPGQEGAFGYKPHAKPASSRLKELYRALARRLHPDVQEQMTPQRKEWWHQAQAAYQKGDLEQLQVILTLCEIEEQGTTAKTSVSLLKRITQQFKLTLRTIKSQLNQFRRDPAWNFSALRDRSALIQRTERLLKAELAELKSALDAIEYQLSTWARQSQMARRRPSRRGYRPSEADYF
jgi:hypothetical protein